MEQFPKKPREYLAQKEASENAFLEKSGVESRTREIVQKMFHPFVDSSFNAEDKRESWAVGKSRIQIEYTDIKQGMEEYWKRFIRDPAKVSIENDLGNIIRELNIPIENFRRITDFILFDGEEKIDMLRLLKPGVDVYMNTTSYPDLQTANDEMNKSTHSMGYAHDYILVNGPINTPVGVATLFHEMGHSIESVKLENPKDYLAMINAYNKINNGEKMTVRDSAIILKSERDAEAFSLRMSKKIFKDNIDLVKEIREYIHINTLKGYTQTLRKITL